MSDFLKDPTPPPPPMKKKKSDNVQELDSFILTKILTIFSSIVDFNNNLSLENEEDAERKEENKILRFHGILKSGTHNLRTISEIPEIIETENGISYFIEFETFISSIIDNPKIIISIIPHKPWTIPQFSPTPISIPLSIRQKVSQIKFRLIENLIKTTERTIGLISSLSPNGEEATIINFFNEINTMELIFTRLNISSVMIRAILDTVGNFFHSSNLIIGAHSHNLDLIRNVTITLKIPENQEILSSQEGNKRKRE